ncbi:MAG: NAD(P)-binding protein [Eubacteriales bacterium]|nr:NAD(P)-binding protein [Eubacteriales bacterium]
MERIIIAGAGIGGMTLAGFLSKQGYTVDVYEKAASLDEMRYDWHDDVAPSIFKELGFNMPKENAPKNDWTFVSPFDKSRQTMKTPVETRDHSIERRPLNKMLFDFGGNANYHFGAEVQSLIIEDGKVNGIVVNGKEERAALTVDSLGLNSVLRNSLPKEFKIQNAIGDNEKFVAYRGFFNRIEGKADESEPSRVYMKHLGENGISWCLFDHDPKKMNVLIGRVAKLSDETFNRAMADLKEKNPALGDTLLRGGIVCQIPIRYPISRMMADGYVLIGDSAFMTIPMLGSGIASSMAAAKILSDVIAENKKFDKASLWEYQVRCFKRFGAEHCGVDSLKRFLLGLKDDTLAWVFGSGLLNDNDLKNAAAGRLVTIKLKDYPEKLKHAKGHFKELLSMKFALDRSNKCYKKAKTIPTKFNEKKVSKWQDMLDGLFK